MAIDDLRCIKGDRLQDVAQLIIEYDGASRQCTMEKASRSWGHDFMMLLGHSNDCHCAVSIRFCTKGEYNLGALKLHSLDTAGYEEDIAALSENALRDASIGKNTLSANITVTGKQKVLCMTIPYSKGWKAKVDGLDAPLLRVQYGFTDIVLDAGEHTISLRYKTPLFMAGVAAAIAGWVILVVYLCVSRKSRAGRADGK